TPNVPILINSNGPATVTLGTGGDAQGVFGSITLINNLASTTGLSVNDSSDSGAHTITMANDGDPRYGQITGLTPAAIRYYYSQLGPVFLTTGTGSNTVNIFSTGSGLVSLEGHSRNTTVNVGNGTTQYIRNGVTITNPPSFTTVNVDDSADPLSRTTTIGTW